MTEWDISSANWRKSSHSADQGGDCIEVATAWRKSSHSGEQGGTCVEVAAGRRAGRVVAVRDSKNPGGPALCFSPAEWSAFLCDLKDARHSD